MDGKCKMCVDIYGNENYSTTPTMNNNTIAIDRSWKYRDFRMWSNVKRNTFTQYVELPKIQPTYAHRERLKRGQMSTA